MKIQFKFSLSDKADAKMALGAFAYDRRNMQVGFAPVSKGTFQFDSDKISIRKSRIFIAPLTEGDNGAVALAQIMKRKAFEVSLPLRFGAVVDLGRIPDAIIDNWLFCICQIKGRVLNSRCENPNIPVPGARVHICDVDPLLVLIEKTPDWQIINLRDYILRHINLDRYLKVPPIIDWPPIGPDPAPFEDILRGKMAYVPNERISKNIQVFNPTLQQQPSLVRESLNRQLEVLRKELFSGNKDFKFTNEKMSFTELFPQQEIAMFLSDDAQMVRKYLLSYHSFIFPSICKILSWFYRYDELATVTTDQNGNFSYYYFYNCKDKPDVYIWIEYPVDGAWATVYRPWVGCNTIWNYHCGSEIIIHVNNPNVPCVHESEVLVGPKSVAVLSMGEQVNVAHVAQAGADKGLPTAGAFAGGPFGATVDTRVYFDKMLALDVNNPGGLNYWYRWSYRREGTSDWFTMSDPVTRHYEDFVPPSPVPVFPAYQIGPNDDMLTRILRHYTPEGKAIFAKYASDLSDGYFNTGGLPGGATMSDGVYEIKLELYKYVGGVAQKVNWTAEGISLYIPTNDIVNFQNTTITTQLAPAAYQYRLLAGVENPAGDLFGFKMKLFVDNNEPVVRIDDFYVDSPGNTPDCCGFVGYGAVNPHIHVDFTAKQKNDFADFQVGIAGYQGMDAVTGANIPSGSLSVAMEKPAQASVPFNGNLAGNYTGDIPVAGALAGCMPPCTKKVIGIGLNIEWYAHNGSNRLWGSRLHTGTTFAIEG